jgi:hypothetical protein
MEKEDRIIPVVGDFAGDHALAAIGAELARRNERVSVFYVSNVEQYLMTDAKWSSWTRNVKSLPAASDAIFVRAYLDQGQKHPKQMPGHRSTTTTQSFERFFAMKRPASFFALAQ